MGWAEEILIINANREAAELDCNKHVITGICVITVVAQQEPQAHSTTESHLPRYDRSPIFSHGVYCQSSQAT